MCRQNFNAQKTEDKTLFYTKTYINGNSLTDRTYYILFKLLKKKNTLKRYFS